MCSVIDCNFPKEQNGKTMFHSYPVNVKLKKIWAKFSKENDYWEPGPRHKICSNHFKPDDFINVCGTMILKKTAIPSIRYDLRHVKCAFEKCKNSKSETPNKLFYNFPKNPNMRKQWCKVVFGSPFDMEIKGNVVICSDHFTKDSFKSNSLVLNSQAVPIKNVSEVKNIDLMGAKKTAVDRINEILLENDKILNQRPAITKTMWNNEGIHLKNEEQEENISSLTSEEDICQETFPKVESVHSSNATLNEENNVAIIEEEDMLSSLKSICRICLIEGDVTNINELESMRGVSVAFILKNYAKIDINFDRRLPQNLCRSCQNQVYALFEFLLKCEYSEKYLKKLVDNNSLVVTKNKIEAVQRVSEDHSYNMVEPIEISDDCLSVASEKPDEKLEYQVELKEEIKEPAENKMKPTLRLQQKTNLIAVTNELSWNVYKPPVRSKGPPYVCLVCHASYEDFADLANHKKETKHRFARYECPFKCGKRVRTLALLREHYQLHTGEKWEKCPHCDFTTKWRTSLSLHMRKHTGKWNFKCDECNMTFSRLEYYKNHQRGHHGEEKLKCEECGRLFILMGLYRKHLIRHQGNIVSRKYNYPPKPFQCELCGRILKSKTALDVHIADHGHANFSCEKCNKMFNSKTRLYRHNYTTHNPKCHMCEYCGKTFKLAQKYKDHIASHLGQIICKVCNKKFSTMNSLKMHMNLHSDQAPIKCHICEKPLRNKGQLTVHLRTHTGEKPFTCNICNRAFALKVNLTTHLATHENRKAIVCNSCGKVFSNLRNCRRHQSRGVCDQKYEVLSQMDD